MTNEKNSTTHSQDMAALDRDDAITALQAAMSHLNEAKTYGDLRYAVDRIRAECVAFLDSERRMAPSSPLQQYEAAPEVVNAVRVAERLGAEAMNQKVRDMVRGVEMNGVTKTNLLCAIAAIPLSGDDGTTP